MVFYGWRRYGRIDLEGGLAVATKFFHIFWLPLVPYRGLIMVSEDQGVKSSLRLRSVMVGYGKVWGPVLLFATLMFGTTGGDDPGDIAFAVVVGLVGAILTGIGYARRFSTFDEVRSAEIHQELQSLASPNPPPSPGTEQ